MLQWTRGLGGRTSHSDLSLLSAQEILHPSSPSSLPPALTLSSHPGCSDPSFLPPAGWRRGPVAVENGCHDNGAQLYPIAVGESVSCPPQAGPHHADEGQCLCPRQLGVPAGNRHLLQLLTHTVTTCCTVTVQSEEPHCVKITALMINS